MKSPKLLLGFLLLLSVCASPSSSSAPPIDEAPAQLPSPTDTPLPDEESSPCGDGVCRGPENPDLCPQDCPVEDDSTSALPDDDGILWVVNPTSGARLFVKMYWPGDWDGSSLPTLVLVPGGFGTSQDFAGERRSAQEMADQGFTVITFDADGRGASEGEEDKNGHTQQDGLAEIVRAASNLPGVDASRIGLVSFSYGVTMASGALARYPDLAVVFYMDWEGPSDRAYTTHDCSADEPGIGSTVGMAPCEDEAFWSEREAVTFIAQIQIPYQRLQFENDHAQEVVTHAVDMINAAAGGTAPWARLNDLPANESYSTSSPPRMFPGSSGARLDDLVIEFADELFSLFAP